MRSCHSALVTALAIFIWMAACAPLIKVTHADQTHPVARVYVDGEDEGPLEYGETMSTRVKWGQHQIVVVEESSGVCVWTEEEEGWWIWVLDEVELTLLPPLEEAVTREVADD